MAVKTLYVGNLPYSTDADALVSHFSDFGGTNARILEGRGFGFVDIDATHLDAAILAKHNSDLGGRRLTVNEARPKGSGGGPRREFGGSGGGYSPGGYGSERTDSSFNDRQSDFRGRDSNGRGRDGRDRRGSRDRY